MLAHRNNFDYSHPTPLMKTATTIFSLIGSLKEEDKAKLYSSPIFCSSFIKLFDKTTNRLFFDLLITAPSLKSLTNKKTIKESLKQLCELGLISKKDSNLYLNESFRSSLMKGFCEINRNVCFEEVETVNTVIDGDNLRFVNILKFIVNNKTNNKSYGVLEILHYGKLIDGTGEITNLGFEFLLKSRKEQVWSLVVLGFSYFNRTVDEQIDNLIALLELGGKKINVVYKPLKPINTRFFKFLESLGLMSASKDQIIFNKFFRDIFRVVQTRSASFLTIETNFKLYAYTKSEYEISIIKLFSEIHLELPNLLKGMITEESVNRAFEKGVTSSQIVHFLESSIYIGDLPVTISNQIRLWESKRNRIQCHAGYLYSNFLNLIDFQKVYKFCADKNCIIDKDVEKRVLIIKPEYNEEIKKYVKSIL